MFPAVVYAKLRTTGELIVPVVGIPNRYDLGDPQPWLPAMALALAVGMLVSGVAYYVVFRPLRQSAPLTMLVATVGLTIVLQGLATKSFGVATVRTPDLLPAGTVTIFGRIVPVDRFWLAGVVVVIAFGLAFVYKVTRFGLATRGAATAEKGALLLGYDTARLGLANWLLASFIVAMVGILSTSIGGVNPFNYSFYVVPALGAALAARMQFLSVAVVAGIAIGSFEALSVHLVAQRTVPDFFLGGFSSLVPFVVIVGALIVLGKTLPTRETILEAHRVETPLIHPRVITWGPVIAAMAAIVLLGDATLRLGAIQTMFATTILLSIVVITGFIGQASLAQLAFAGFSAFMLSRFSGLPFPLGPVTAVGLTTIVGASVGIPALRIRGIQFAIVTFSAAVVFEELIFRSPSFAGRSGLAVVEEPSLFGYDFGIFSGAGFPSRRFGIAMLLFTVGAALLVVNLRRSAVGRRFLAVRDNERAAAAAGIDVPRTKLLGAGIASFLAAIAGVMFAYKSVQFSGGGLEAETGLELVALAYLGGIGTVAGATIGGLLAPSGLFIVAVSSGAPSINQFLLTGVGLLVVTVKFPGGIASLLRRGRWWNP